MGAIRDDGVGGMTCWGGVSSNGRAGGTVRLRRGTEARALGDRLRSNEAVCGQGASTLIPRPLLPPKGEGETVRYLFPLELGSKGESSCAGLPSPFGERGVGGEGGRPRSIPRQFRLPRLR